MTLDEFEQHVLEVALASPLCGIPLLRRLTNTSINLRIDVVGDGFIDAFYNEQTGTTAFALIHQERRIYGADNTGGWHMHPFTDPAQHVPIPNAMTFADFVATIERQYP